MFKIERSLIYILVIALLFTTLSFYKLKANEFLFIHDELLLLTKEEAQNSLYIRANTDFNVDNTTALTVSLFDRIYYFIGYSIGLKTQELQILMYFLKYIILLGISYIGFKSYSGIIKETNNIRQTKIIIWMTTLFYIFNTYTIIYWHTNAFPLNLIFCYAFAPLGIYYLHRILTDEKPSLRLYLITALILFIMSFSVYLFAVFTIVVGIYTLVLIGTNLKLLKLVPLKLLKLLILTAPLFAILIPLVLKTIIGTNQVNATGGATYMNLRGGILYPLFFWFSWAIYNEWTPRNIFTFNDYYKSIIYLISPLIIYGIIFVSFINNKIKKQNLYMISFWLIFIVSLIFVKGPQPPLGFFYLELIEKFPPFRVFRSPDTKFGFSIIISLSFLLLYYGQKVKLEIFTIAMSIVIAIQTYPLVSGKAIYGENTSTSSDRIIYIPKEYEELKSQIQDVETQKEYILPIPSTSFDHFIFNEYEKHLGQDLLPKVINLPFVYVTESSSMPIKTYQKLNTALSKNHEELNDFPIKYYLVRDDLEFRSATTLLSNENSKNFNKIFESKKFTLYKATNYASLVEGLNVGSVHYEQLSPVKFKVKVDGINPSSKIILNTNYDSGWDLYIKNQEIKTRQNIYNNYANQWDLNPKLITDNFNPKYYVVNPDNTISTEITLYYQPQSTYNLLAGISILLVLTYSAIIFKHYVKRK